ncbi:MAG: SAM-dependent methyltransferase, partial [Clostridia bacterium]|nr:SAM-dependent methyltransferase [Clostridia bacterium]
SLSLLTRYGIIQERFSALLTDSVRANLLEYCGYKTQVLEFVDFAHTPKNLLIRAVLNPSATKKSKEKALAEVDAAIAEFNVKPTLYGLLMNS